MSTLKGIQYNPTTDTPLIKSIWTDSQSQRVFHVRDDDRPVGTLSCTRQPRVMRDISKLGALHCMELVSLRSVSGSLLKLISCWQKFNGSNGRRASGNSLHWTVIIIGHNSKSFGARGKGCCSAFFFERILLSTRHSTSVRPLGHSNLLLPSSSSSYSYESPYIMHSLGKKGNVRLIMSLLGKSGSWHILWELIRRTNDLFGMCLQAFSHLGWKRQKVHYYCERIF